MALNFPAELIEDPFALQGAAPARPFAPAARRTLTVLGRGAELLWLPERAQRTGIPTGDRPPFRPAVADRILAEEALWEDSELALTPNRFPFARRQVVVWSKRPVREATPAMLELAFAVCDACPGRTALLNTVGAAASIPRAHLHIVGETLGFLADGAETAWEDPVLGSLPEGACVAASRLDAPVLVAVLRGPAAARAAAAHRLLELRTTPAFNLVASEGTTWILPRTEVEIPAPEFPHALGAAELWGRWCYADEDAFRAATSAQLERALLRSSFPSPRARSQP